MTGGAKGQEESRKVKIRELHRQQGLRRKNLIGMPWRVALALQDDGWYLRQDNIWDKLNPMPESCLDRTTRSHEYVFMLSKTPRYFYDKHAIEEEVSGGAHARGTGETLKQHDTGVGWTKEDRKDSGITLEQRPRYKREGRNSRMQEERDKKHLESTLPKMNDRFQANVTQLTHTRNKRSVWRFVTSPFAMEMCKACSRIYSALDFKYLKRDGRRSICLCGRKDSWVGHFATFPPQLPEICVKAGTSEFGACGKCGTPYVRIIKKVHVGNHNPEPGSNGKGKRNQISNAFKGAKYYEQAVERHKGTNMAKSRETYREESGLHDGYIPRAVTAGWKPGCKCELASVVPCVVMDPFSGAGTTGLVALRNLRAYIGVEKNPHYAAMTKRRIIDDFPLFNSIALQQVPEIES